MAGKRFRAEQIIMKLREAEVGLAQGQRVGQVSKQMGVSEQTYYRWRKEYGGLRFGPGQEVEGVGEGEYPVEEAGGGSVFGQADPEGSVLGKPSRPDEQETSGDVGTRAIRSRASLRTSGLPSAGTGSIDPAKGKANSR